MIVPCRENDRNFKSFSPTFSDSQCTSSCGRSCTCWRRGRTGRKEEEGGIPLPST